MRRRSLLEADCMDGGTGSALAVEAEDLDLSSIELINAGDDDSAVVTIVQRRCGCLCNRRWMMRCKDGGEFGDADVSITSMTSSSSSMNRSSISASFVSIDGESNGESDGSSS